MKFRIFYINLLLILFILLVPKAYAAEPILDVILPSSGYLDIPDNHWAYTEIKELQILGVMGGYPDGKFRPDSTITREEFATAAIKALKLDDYTVVEPLKFDDFLDIDWAWDYVQNAYYFGLFTPPRMDKNGYYLFRPEDSITRGHAFVIAVNALKTMPITEKKAKAVLQYAYDDYYNVPKHFVMSFAKAQLLDMVVTDPRKHLRKLDYDKPITRAETAVLLYNMLEEAKINPNEKIKKAMDQKKVAQGHIITDAYMEDDVIAVIPKGTVLPLVVTGSYKSKKAFAGEKYTALVPKNFIHENKYLLLPSGTKFYGRIKEAKRGIPLFRNGVLTFENDTIVIKRQPAVRVEGVATLKNLLTDTRFRRIFKGENLEIDRGEFLQMELKQDLKIDVTTGKILKLNDL